MKKALIVIIIVILVLTVLTVAGLVVFQYFAGQTTDGPVMENPAGPMLELLNARWTSEDGLWEAQIEDYTLELRHQQDLVYSGSFSFDFNGNDPNVRTELDVSDTQFASEDGSVCGTLESLYAESGRLYLDITVSNEGEDNVRQQIVLNRAQPGEPEMEEIREVSEMAELVEFSWNQICIGDNGFRFHIVCAGGDPADPRLSCRYMDQEANRILQIGDEGSIEACPTIPAARWEELADFLRKAELLPAYREPDPHLTGDMEVDVVPFVSKIQVTWRDGGEEFTNRYRGNYADELLELLKDIARETNFQKSGQSGEPEPEEIREVSEMAELVAFSWRQSAMSYDDCFQFRIKTTEHDLSDPRLFCRYTDPETYERVEIGDDDSIGFQGFGLGGTRLAENETWLPVPPERWAELADFLRKAELSAYFAPDPGLMDATSSIIAVTWREDGEEFTNRYGGGTSAHDLLKLLQDIAREAEPAAPAGWTCSCGQGGNEGKFCTECGQPRPAGAPRYKCGRCGWEPADPTKPPNFCPECGDPFDEGDIQ